MRVRRFSKDGTGVFIGAGRVLTAGHVVYRGSIRPRLADFTVTHPDTGQAWSVTRIRVPAGWRVQDPEWDLALLDVDGPQCEALPIAGDFAGGLVTRFGLPSDPTDPLRASATGIVGIRKGLLFAEDPALAVPAGASGGPLVHAAGGPGGVVGIAVARGGPTPDGVEIGVVVSAERIASIENEPSFEV